MQVFHEVSSKKKVKYPQQQGVPMELKHYLCCILHPKAARAGTSPMACNDSAWMVDRPIVPDLGVLHLSQVIMTKKRVAF